MIFDIVNLAFDVMTWLLIIRVFLSWIPHNPYNAVISFVYEMTDYILTPVRKAMPLVFGGVDFSPIAAFILLEILRPIVINILARII